MTTTDNSAVPDYLSRLRIEGKNLLVVGAGNGMGRQTTHAFAQAGARVACVDIDDVRATEVADEVGGVAIVGDATRREDVERIVVEATAALGPLDGFVDIVGISTFMPILEMDDETFDYDQRMNLRHAYLVSQLVGRQLAERGGGTMVFICSISGLSAAPLHASYGAAKAGLMAWIRSLAEELGPKGVRANGVAPGAILTPRNEERLPATQKEKIIANAPLGRFGTPEDIANAALFLTSDLSSYITGQVLVVDGGVGIKLPYPMDL